jgi:hypothetical protein
MSHTKDQRRKWHAGKRMTLAPTESVFTATVRLLKSRNHGAAWTPKWMKRGLMYNSKGRINGT